MYYFSFIDKRSIEDFRAILASCFIMSSCLPHNLCLSWPLILFSAPHGLFLDSVLLDLDL